MQVISIFKNKMEYLCIKNSQIMIKNARKFVSCLKYRRKTPILINNKY